MQIEPLKYIRCLYTREKNSYHVSFSLCTFSYILLETYTTVYTELKKLDNIILGN